MDSIETDEQAIEATTETSGDLDTIEDSVTNQDYEGALENLKAYIGQLQRVQEYLEGKVK